MLQVQYTCQICKMKKGTKKNSLTFSTHVGVRTICTFWPLHEPAAAAATAAPAISRGNHGQPGVDPPSRQTKNYYS